MPALAGTCLSLEGPNAAFFLTSHSTSTLSIYRSLRPMCGRHPVGKDFLQVQRAGRQRPCVRPVCSARTPMAFMLSARSAPDQKHALEAPWDNWVLLIYGDRPLLHDLRLALSNLVRHARLGAPILYAAAPRVRDTRRLASSKPRQCARSCLLKRQPQSWSCAAAGA